VTFFREQNEKIRNRTWVNAGETHVLNLDTLGIINGCVDTLVREPSYPEMAYNNTYGIEAINGTVYESSLRAFNEPGGVKELIQKCRALAAEGNPENQRNNDTVNQAYSHANDATGAVENPYISLSNRGYYDTIAVSNGVIY
jgi:hypothetical protein